MVTRDATQRWALRNGRKPADAGQHCAAVHGGAHLSLRAMGHQLFKLPAGDNPEM